MPDALDAVAPEEVEPLRVQQHVSLSVEEHVARTTHSAVLKPNRDRQVRVEYVPGSWSGKLL